MKTSFKKAIRFSQKIYLIHKKCLSAEFCWGVVQGVLSGGLCPGGLYHDTSAINLPG